MFTGRLPEVEAIERCLYQAKNGSPQHFLIQGERGIGKSSLLYFIDITASGKIKFVDGKYMHFISVPVDLGGCNTQVDIIRAIGRNLKAALSKQNEAREKAKSVIEWFLNWEVLGVRFHKENPEVDPQDLADELVDRIASLMKATEGYVDGLLFLIDEADQPPASAGLGQFLKLFTERLTRAGCNKVLVGMAGLPSIINKMKESHESSPRIFQTMLLEPLEIDERKSVVRSGLIESNKKNANQTTITADALTLIATLSEGYPHFIQQFSYSAFDSDTDDNIDVADVIAGAYDENGAIAQLGRKYFDEMYYGKISSEDYRRVLNAMANYSDAWVARKTLVAEAGVKETTLNNALNTLKAKNVIVADDARQGFYKLPTKSFAAWINAIRSVEEKSEAGQGSLFSAND